MRGVEGSGGGKIFFWGEGMYFVRIFSVHLYYQANFNFLNLKTMKAATMTRFDTRLSAEMKKLFEEAAELGGYKTLSEFVIYSVKLQAEKIMDKHNAILASEKDQKIFFDAIMNPGEPNDKLKAAAERYKKMTKKNELSHSSTKK